MLPVSDIDSAILTAQARVERASDLSYPLGLLGIHHVQKGRRLLASGERGIRTRHGQSGLAASLTPRADTMSLGIGSNKIYAGSQQSGPRGGFYESSRPNGVLSLPIADALGAGGVAKAGFETPRNFPEGSWIRTKLGNLLFVIPLGVTAKGKTKQRKKFKGMPLAQDSTLSKFKVLFLGLRRVAGYAHRYITHDPADQSRWNQLSANWVLNGR